jgi:flagellar biosynthesis chaperone FliJ
LDISQSRIKELEGRDPVCGHGDLQERIQELQKQSARELPPDIEELQQELEDAQEQLGIIPEEKTIYQIQVDKVMVLA